MERRRGRGRKRRRRTNLTKMVRYQRRQHQRRRGRFVQISICIFNSVLFIGFCYSVFSNIRDIKMVSASFLSEDWVPGTGADSGGMASLCLDHRHSSSEVSLHTSDGRRGISFSTVCALNLLFNISNSLTVKHIQPNWSTARWVFSCRCTTSDRVMKLTWKWPNKKRFTASILRNSRGTRWSYGWESARGK